MSFKKETPLANAVFWAARKGNLALLQLLLNSGRVDADCRDSYGTTALMVASYSGHYDCVKELIMQGADINYQRETGSTALFFASQQGHHDVVKLLFEFGASTEFQTKEASKWNLSGDYLRIIAMFLCLEDGSTALFKAALKGHNSVIEELLKFSPSLGLLKNGSTALHAAVMGGDQRTVQLLLGANADPALPNKSNELPADLTKSDRILKVLHLKLLNGDS
ncbi:ankyrin repeat domain-containing protein 29 [Seriola lalandi dorsalis]|uniref:ankyrin repeat domain-containing protein 29 n=1 Tax=Seriola lalandi dorsalis TaxID=1841481 RepID=UPI000C6F7756|nr:ankyrin repeat domain-containing protein 29 [Seriola lalandi dorsalis]